MLEKVLTLTRLDLKDRRKIGRPLQIDYHILSDERHGDKIILNLKTVVLSSTIRPASIQTSRLRPLISHQQKKDWHM